jgi:hypothetical protein
MDKEKDGKPDSADVCKFVFSKKVTDLDLFKYDSVKELFNCINDKDIELVKVKMLIKKANKEMRIGNNNIRLFIRKAKNLGAEDKKRICVTTK